MMRPPNCPICSEEIAVEAIGPLDGFPCPNCDELVRTVLYGGGTSSRVVMIAFIVVVCAERGLGWREFLGGLLLVPVAIALLNAVLNRVFGYQLEPVGRIGLGWHPEE